MVAASTFDVSFIIKVSEAHLYNVDSEETHGNILSRYIDDIEKKSSLAAGTLKDAITEVIPYEASLYSLQSKTIFFPTC